jgi:hypothetical protein
MLETVKNQNSRISLEQTISLLEDEIRFTDKQLYRLITIVDSLEYGNMTDEELPVKEPQDLCERLSILVGKITKINDKLTNNLNTLDFHLSSKAVKACVEYAKG